MRRFLLPGLISCAAVALLVLLAAGILDQGTSSSIDAQVAAGRYPLAPVERDALPLLQRPGNLSLADLRGKVVLVNVFASWCGPCVQEAPILEHAQRMLAASGGTVLGVTYQDNASDASAFMRTHHLTYPVVRDVGEDLIHAFGVTGVPETFLINRSGRIQALRRYQLSSQWVEQTLPPVLKGSA
jgi:cytochrome c biogenesis protein CcmG/thiol:disulfide interchange protein DsbE